MTDAEVDRNLERAFQLAREIMARPDDFPDDFVVLPLDDETILRVLTGERLRLVRVVRDEGPFDSIAELAAAVDREPSRVGRDLSWLEEVGLLRTERHGRSKRVHRTDRKILLA